MSKLDKAPGSFSRAVAMRTATGLRTGAGGPARLRRAKESKNAQPAANARRMDELLDEALRETFPASDPVAINLG